MVLSTASIRAALVASLLLSVAAEANPFDTTDQNPLLAGFSIPRPFAARVPNTDTTSFAATLNWSSIAAIQQSPNEDLIVDAESREWRISLEHTFAERFAVRVEIPYRTLNGGTLDNFISHWHSTFGLPQGDRPALPVNDFRIQYSRFGNQIASYTQSESGVGDLSLSVGYQLVNTTQAATSAWGSIKFPTGNDGLIGSGAYDAALSVAHSYEMSHRWIAFAQANGVYLGAGEALTAQQRRWLWDGLVGFDYRYSNALALTVQLDGHTAAFTDSTLDLLGNAWILTFGGEYRFKNQWRAQFGISEDVKVEASPDVTFVLTIARSWK